MKNALILFVGSLFICSCIDRINIVIPDSYASQLVVDGVITDEPGPYTIRLSKATRIEKFLLLNTEVESNARITIIDNAGISEILTEIEPGTYQTKVGGIQGVIGRSYSVKIETKDGRIFESLPDTMSPVGELDSLYYEFESYTPLADQTRYGFRFYIDAQGLPGVDNFLRWKFTEVFEIDAVPKVHTSSRPFPCTPEPSPCSGWILGEFGLQQVSNNCSCCKCWVTRYEDKPHINDNQFVSNNKVKRVEVGYVPLEYFPFQKGKYRVEVKQMSLSQVAFDYWRIILSQKEGAASLFQPPTGKIKTNIFGMGDPEDIQGIFYASSVKKKQYYLGYKDVKVIQRVPLWDCEEGIIAQDCRLAFPNSSTLPPADWK